MSTPHEVSSLVEQVSSAIDLVRTGQAIRAGSVLGALSQSRTTRPPDDPSAMDLRHYATCAIAELEAGRPDVALIALEAMRVVYCPSLEPSPRPRHLRLILGEPLPPAPPSDERDQASATSGPPSC